MGSPISTEDHIDVILNGLPEEYDPYTVDEIEALLLTQEEQLEKHKFPETSILQANTISAPHFTENFTRARYQSTREIVIGHKTIKRFQDSLEKQAQPAYSTILPALGIKIALGNQILLAVKSAKDRDT